MKNFAALALLGFLFGVCGPALAANSRVEAELGNQGNLSMFYQALLNTGVANELNEDTDYSVFAPTNAAFQQISPTAYPCFYSSQCRNEVAALLRNHIIPTRRSIRELAQMGEVETIGNGRILVEEPYINTFSANGNRIAYMDNVNALYQIDGVIVDKRELSEFAKTPPGPPPGTVAERTVTTSRTVIVPSSPGGYLLPGGIPSGKQIYWPPEAPNESSTTVIVH
ncbi:MAG: fasciclin domain-containing protein [Alphaproteobacteria bacterium]|nr:fasciclin domain-containing protein [Alphaproteobacteria bacterium]